jgi:methyl-accepting chemotaxis protein
MRFANLRIGQRLAFGFAAIEAFLIVITAIGIWRLQEVADSTRNMMEAPLAKERLVSDWYRTIYGGIRSTIAVVKSSDPALGVFFAEETAANIKKSQEMRKRMEELATLDAEKTLLANLSVVAKKRLTTLAEITKEKERGNQEGADKIFTQDFYPATKEYENILKQLLDLQRSHIDSIAHEIDTIAIKSRNLLLVLGALVGLFGVICAWTLTSGITSPLKAAVALARRVADGDLAVAVGKDSAGQSNDEAGQLLQALIVMNGNLSKIVTQVRAGTETIAMASGEVAAGSRDLSARTERQASSLEETAASMEELTSTVKQNADNARQANGLALSASNVAGKGSEVVSEVVTMMERINESSRKIVDIIGVIDGIAFQTNILALNAAVEAARAGEQGRGFAVVASEVRALAQRSASAAKEIKTLIGDSVGLVDAGSRLVHQAGKTMSEIGISINRVTDIMGEITAASQEQTSGIEQINQAITQMDEVTQQNAALVEQAAAAAEAMQDQTRRLSELASVFKLADRQRMPTRSDIAPAVASVPVLAKAARAKQIARGDTTAAPRGLQHKAAVTGSEWEEF